MVLLPLLVAGVRFEHVARGAAGLYELHVPTQLDAVGRKKLLPSSIHRENGEQDECRGQDSATREPPFLPWISNPATLNVRGSRAPAADHPRHCMTGSSLESVGYPARPQASAPSAEARAAPPELAPSVPGRVYARLSPIFGHQRHAPPDHREARGASLPPSVGMNRGPPGELAAPEGVDPAGAG